MDEIEYLGMPLKYPLELKVKATCLLKEGIYSVQEISELLGVSASVVYKWRNMKLDERESNFNVAEKQELLKLRRTVKELQLEIEILKKARRILDQENKTKFNFIKRESNRFPVRLLCRVLNVGKSAFYDWNTSNPID